MRSDLKAVDGVANVETDLDELTCCFDLSSDVDPEKLMNRLAETNNKIKDWKRLQ